MYVYGVIYVLIAPTLYVCKTWPKISKMPLEQKKNFILPIKFLNLERKNRSKRIIFYLLEIFVMG
jgi:hypothetical protein